MGARFVGDPKVAAGVSPFRAVGRQAAPARAELGQEMGQFMAQGAVDLGGVVFAQTRIQGDEGAAEIGPAGGAEKASIPFDAEIASQFRSIEGLEQFPRFGLEIDITTEDDEAGRRRKNEVELPVV